MADQSALETVTDYINDVRTLMLDTVSPYRYDDTSLLTAFNTAILEGRRLRPDLFVFHHRDKVPYFAANNSEPFNMEAPFRLAFVYGTAAHAFARDQESVEDERANAFMGMFYEMLTGVKPPVLAGGAPPKG